ncbi:hypothetical protein FJR48_04465 [Sulfurimonas lithotrophica]|uniref:Uncharacterized protein n=1 Tax=Sulfurimonas lithotrophica TaxID=2590022 RepID=A0A5P8NZY8_9BACT|nr:hypothetical protein [Sulfurimonas lithotrophica]QFR49016.1 hypothetical protein FJR48_04465 [Sulfurimonas lithotrophica]
MKIIFLILLSTLLFADIKDDIFNYYQNEKYEDACTLGHKWLDKNIRDEEFISLYAFSCLKSDYIDRLSIPISLLKFSRESRSNSAYFSVILMQKKLLYHSLVDGYNLSKLKLPSTDYILSKVFDLYSELGEHEARTLYIFTDKKNPRVSYKLYVINDEQLSKMVIEEYFDTISIQRHVYW